MDAVESATLGRSKIFADLRRELSSLLQTLEHLHLRSVCDPAVEILDEVQQWNPVV